MIYGIGIDLVHVPEFESALQDENTHFFRSYFSVSELDYCHSGPKDQRARRFAARYAAKEACLKALDGARLHSPAAFRFDYPEAAVCKDEYGRPFFQFAGNLAEFVRELQLQSRLSLSHTGDYAIAQVSMEWPS